MHRGWWAAALDGTPHLPHDDGVIPTLGPVEVLPGVWAANLAGFAPPGGHQRGVGYVGFAGHII